MKSSSLLSLLVLPFLVSAQSTASSQSLQVITSIISSTGVDSNHQATTLVTTTLVTVTPSASPSQSSNSTNSASGNSTSPTSSGSGNSSTTASSTTQTSNLPTAPTNVTAGGNGPNGAPSPGATGGNYGPNDGFTAAAIAIGANGMLVAALGVVVGGAVVLI